MAHLPVTARTRSPRMDDAQSPTGTAPAAAPDPATILRSPGARPPAPARAPRRAGGAVARRGLEAGPGPLLRGGDRQQLGGGRREARGVGDRGADVARTPRQPDRLTLEPPAEGWGRCW